MHTGVFFLTIVPLSAHTPLPQGAEVNPIPQLKKKFGIEVRQPVSGRVHKLYLETANEQTEWLGSLLRAAISDSWPSGLCYGGTEFEQKVVRSDLPLLKEVPTFRRKALLLQKMKLCAVAFKFDDADVSVPQCFVLVRNF